LRDLELGGGTELYLGVVHARDGVAGTKARIAAARRQGRLDRSRIRHDWIDPLLEPRDIAPRSPSQSGVGRAPHGNHFDCD